MSDETGLGLRSVLGEALRLYRRAPIRLTLTAAIPFVVIDATYAASELLFEEPTFGRVLAAGTLYLAGTAATFVVYGALVDIADAVRAAPESPGRPPHHARVLSIAGPLLATGFAACLAGAAGLLLLVVPGLFVLTRWSVPLQVVVLEEPSWRDALSRSSRLVKGRGSPVFGWVAISFVVYVGAYGVLYELVKDLPAGPRAWLSGYPVDVTLFPFLAVAWTVLYYRLLRASSLSTNGVAVPAG